MSDNVKDLIEEINYFSDDEYEKRRAARQARVEAEKKRQLLYRKLFVGGIGVILVVAIIVILVNTISCAVKKNNSENNNQDVADQQTLIPTDTDVTVPEEVVPDTVDNNAVFNSFGKQRLYTFDAADYSYTENGSTASVTFSGFYSQYAIVIDVNDKSILASMQGYARMYPASMTKVMTVLTAKQYISDDELDNYIEITQDATDYAFSHGCSAVNFSVGERVTIRDLFYGTILKSGADAAYMLAVYVAGSHEAFVDLMNENCEALGISETTHFSNCVGIYTDDNYSTCYDIAVIMAATLSDSFLQEVMAARKYTTSATTENPEGITISNLFLRRIEDFVTGGYVCAAKTGFVNQSGNCAVSYMMGDDGKDYVCVTGHGASAWQEVYDHIALYNIYVMENNSYTEAVKKAQ